MILFYISTFLITALATSWLVVKIAGRNDWRAFGPMGVLMLSFIYYCGIGPWVNYKFGMMVFQGVSFKSSLSTSALMPLVAFICCVVGYRVAEKRGDVALIYKFTYALKGEVFLYALFFALFLASQGGNIFRAYNIFGQASQKDLESTMNAMGFQMYFYLVFSGCVACCVVMWAKATGFFRKNILAFALTGNLLLVILATGFRLRIAFLMICLISIFVLRMRANPKWHSGHKWFMLKRVVLVAFCGLLILSGMSTARKYGRGLDMDQLNKVDSQDMVLNMFNDINIYFVGGLTADYVSNTYGHTYFETYRATMLRMIPSAIYGKKPLPLTVEMPRRALGNSAAARSAGFAIPYYTENYISFGWPGVILGSLVLGYACAAVGNHLLKKRTAHSALLYVLVTGYVFVYFHRGYFPQQFEYFMFMVGVPWIAFYYMRDKRYRV